MRDEVLLPEIKRIHQENYSVCGVGKMHHAMLRVGWQIGRDQVARLMRNIGLQGAGRDRKPCTTGLTGQLDTRLDLIERRLAAKRPH
ncbi:IS3 family transposase [Buchananella hordeovulneris]|uniref:IS3 family transposase n=1 Tax=Buchananella hordeovulneris TaxID=52770 RepID=UPI00130183F7|nr:IS3 family transposase [Buchananella hordeovulneris]